MELEKEDLRDRQENEVEALKAIFADDFEDIRENEGSESPVVLLHLAHQSELETAQEGSSHNLASLDLTVRFPPEYPNRIPELSVTKIVGVPLKKKKGLEADLKKLARSKIGEEMIFDLVQHVNDFLSEYKKTPSSLCLYDQMVQKRKDEEEEERLKQERKLEEEKRRIDEAISQREEEMKMKKVEDVVKDGKSVHFADQIDTYGSQSKVMQLGTCLSKKESTSESLVFVGMTGNGDLVAVRIWEFQCKSAKKGGTDQIVSRRLKQISSVEQELHSLKDLDHPNLVRYVDMSSSCDMDIITTKVVTQYVQGITLSGMLSQECPLSHAIVRQYAERLLQALSYLHKRGVIHKDIGLSNVFVDKNGSVRLANFSIHKRLADLYSMNQGKVEGEVLEGAGKTNLLNVTGTGKKGDVLKLGQVILSLALGKRVMYPRSIPDSLPLVLQDFLQKMLKREERDRLSAKDLLQHPFILLTPSVLAPSQRPDENEALPVPTSEAHLNPILEPPKKVKEPTSSPPPMAISYLEKAGFSSSTSRLLSDFFIQEELGSGAFGIVWKVQNKLDGCIYAIKKVLLSSRRNDARTKKIVREVELLSRLNHENVVRYYNSWIETERNQPEEKWLDDDDETTSDEEEKLSAVKHHDESSSAARNRASFNSGSGDFIAFQRGGYSDGLELSFGGSTSSSEQLFDEDTKDILDAQSSSSSSGSESDTSDEDLDVIFEASESGRLPLKALNSSAEDEDTKDILDAQSSSSSSSSGSESDTSDEDLDVIFEASESGRLPLRALNSSVEDEDDAGPNRNSSSLTPYLYIQMEFCENNTLRDLVDQGSLYQDKARIWQLFKEMVEGLVHVHKQKIIHRDLKPQNIFLSASGHVKIGDLGLATTDTFSSKLGVAKSESLLGSRDKSSDAASLTGQVGTALYASPEINDILLRAVRYTDKADIYSLGIILFEMCYPPLKTSMEKMKVIGNLRKPTPMFPQGFENMWRIEAPLIGRMLSHQAKDRPSAEELLRSDFMPLNMEDSHLRKALKDTLSSADSSRYRDVMDALFNQPPSAVDDHMYDLDRRQVGISRRRTKVQSLVLDRMSDIFSRHGAVEVQTALLMPKNDVHAAVDTCMHVMDSSGCLVSLPHDLRTPFARYIAKSNITHLKRYSIGRVYRNVRLWRAHPKELLEGAFDIVTPVQTSLVPDAEVIYVVSQVIAEFPKLQSLESYSLYLNHTSLVASLMHHFFIPDDKQSEICNVLWDIQNGKLRRYYAQQQLRRLSLTEAAASSLISLASVRVPFDQVRSYLEPLFKDRAASRVEEALHELEVLLSALRSFDFQHKIIIWPGLLFKVNHYSGIMFRYVAEADLKRRGRQRGIDCLAVGGRYDALIKKFQTHHSSAGKNCSAVGVSIAVERIVSVMAGSDETNYWRGVRSVLVYDGEKSDLSNEKLKLLQALWSAGINAQLSDDIESFYSPESLPDLHKQIGIQHVVELVLRPPVESPVANVWSLDKEGKAEATMVSLADVPEHIQSFSTARKETQVAATMAKSTANQPSHSTGSQPESSVVIPSSLSQQLSISLLLSEKKIPSNIKRRHQSMATAKASSLLNWFSGKQPIEILVIDLTKEMLDDIHSSLHTDDDEKDFAAKAKTIIERYSFRRRDRYLEKVIEHIKELGWSRKMPVILYSISEDRCDLVF